MTWIAPSEKDILTGTLEKRLWDNADQFRANSGLKAQEYSGPILGIIFLRFAEVRFIAQRAKLETAAAFSRRGSRVDEPAAYHAEGFLYLAPTPSASRSTARSNSAASIATPSGTCAPKREAKPGPRASSVLPRFGLFRASAQTKTHRDRRREVTSLDAPSLFQESFRNGSSRILSRTVGKPSALAGSLSFCPDEFPKQNP